MYIQYNKKNMIYERKRTRGDIEKLFRNLNLPHQHNQKKKTSFEMHASEEKNLFFINQCILRAQDLRYRRRSSFFFNILNYTELV